MQRAIDLRGAVAINVITMIGIGPLITIPLVLAQLAGPLALLAWIAGALLALCDGLVWAELSSRFPGSGGTYVYLREAFGPHGLGRLFAFLFNWQYLLFAPCVLASGYIGLAGYAAYLFPALESNAFARDGVAVGTALLTIALLYRRTSQVAAIGNAFGLAATLTIALVALAALTHANFSQAFHLDGPVAWNAAFLAGFGTALYITIYDYAGYSEIALVGDEVVRPNRTIPLAILLSIAIVTALYLLLQIGVLGVVPWRSLLDAHGVPTAQAQFVGSTVVERAWGGRAAQGVTVLVLITAFASLYGNLLGASRVPFAAARDGAFIPAFAKLHPRKGFPYVSLLAIGGLSIVASFFTLDQVIAFLTAGIILVGVLQMAALARLRFTAPAPPFSMPLYPLPLLIDVAASIFTFCYTGWTAILLGAGWLALGFLLFLGVAKIERWWPFAAAVAALAFALLPSPASARAPASPWSRWHASAVQQHDGYPVFTVGGKPFFVFGAAFFYERIPAMAWQSTLEAYRRLGINTIDLYVVWNWHQPAAGAPPDFSGTTVPERNLPAVLAICHALGLHVILRPGPVIRNEWRNGGYPAWLLERPEYDMPLHDVLEGRYPATATLQNAHADAAASEWLSNETHLRYSAAWLHAVLTAAAPYANDVIAIALDDDQGAYIDNDTWPAPHWRAYIEWLRLAVQSTAGTRVPLFINTFETKVPAAAPAWAWGDWYQSDAYSIGPHDLSQIDFATGLLGTQPGLPVMQAEFQAGWLQGADEGAPRPADPTNTALALHELLRDGAHGIVDFPLQDTIDPAGWEAPWANWSYAWDAALTTGLASSPRYAPTAAFGDLVRRYGPLLADTHPVADVGIVWPASLFSSSILTNHDFAAFADATIAMQRGCERRRIACRLIDLAYADEASIARLSDVVIPIEITKRLAASIGPPVERRLDALRRSGRLVADLDRVGAIDALPVDDATFLASNGTFGASQGFLDVVNPSDAPRSVGSVTVGARQAQLIPVGIAAAPASETPAPPEPAAPPPFTVRDAIRMEGDRLRVAFAPNAGARIGELSAAGIDNAASSVGLLRDAVDPQATPSSRDYIAAYTHPLPAGTFNRPYACTQSGDATALRVTCAYDAPDVPAGGAHFERTLELARDGQLLDVTERFAPHDSAAARLQSISGFALAPGDEIVAPPGAAFAGVLHGHRFAVLAWRPDEIASVALRSTRGAELVTLTFSAPTAHLALGILAAADPAEAERALQANPPLRPR